MGRFHGILITLCTEEEGELPPPRNDLTVDLEEDESMLERNVVNELGNQGGLQAAPLSPVQESGFRENERGRKRKRGDRVENSTPATASAITQATPPATASAQVSPMSSTTVVTREKELVNSDIFPAEERPALFKEDAKFNL